MTAKTNSTAPRRIPFASPSIGEGERRLVQAVLAESRLTQGPQVAFFEEEFEQFVGGGHAVATSSCMGALHLAYLILGIGPGDDVLCPALSHVATALAIEQVGATPIFVDCAPDTGNVTQAGLSAARTPETRAVTLVHFLGQPCAMFDITPWARTYKLRIVEDCALALGSFLQKDHVGLWGDVGCFSFYPTKLITTGEGGMLLARQKTVAEQAKKGRAFGVEPCPSTQLGDYDAVTPFPGLNYRMPETAAAMGRVQLVRARSFIASRQANASSLWAQLRQRLDWTCVGLGDRGSVPYALCLRLPSEQTRNRMQQALARAHIGTSIYYPRPIPAMRYFVEKYGYAPDRFPHAEAICRETLCLPCHPDMSEDDITYVAEQVTEAAAWRG